MVLTTLTAYPLARESSELKGRTGYMWFLLFPMLFSGGLIPMYLWMRQLDLLNRFWVLVLPSAVPVFNVIMMMNFFRGLPGASARQRSSTGPAICAFSRTSTCRCRRRRSPRFRFSASSIIWNAWFDALMFINEPTKLPLQTVMQNLIAQARDLLRVVQQGNAAALRKISKKNVSSAAMIVSIVPILLAYPFLQKHFISGVVIGSIKE